MIEFANTSDRIVAINNSIPVSLPLSDNSWIMLIFNGFIVFPYFINDYKLKSKRISKGLISIFFNLCNFLLFNIAIN